MSVMVSWRTPTALQRLGLTLWTLCAAAGLAHAAELKPETVEAFERYIRLTEARIDAELHPGTAFLRVDAQPEPRREATFARLRRGEAVIERMQTRDAGREIDCPGGMIHHWLATAFVPGVTLQQVLAVSQDYDNYQNIYRPDVQRSKLLRREGDRFEVYLRFYKKTIVTVVLNTESVVRYFLLGEGRAHTQSHSTRIAQVDSSGTPEEREKPVGIDSGYLWRLNIYWRFEERDGGVYLQAETVGLTRDIPFAFRWLVGPLVSRIPRETLRATLIATRNALIARHSPPQSSSPRPQAGP
jgi:hypothetical protein